MNASTRQQGVVVGVDGSPTARHAVHWAAREAALRDVPLTVVYAVPPLAGSSMVAPLPADVLEWERANGRQCLEDAEQLAKTSTDGSVNVTTKLSASQAVPTLVVESEQAELLVVGRRGHNALARTLLGSVSSGVLRHAHCPVAIVHDEPSPAPAADAPVIVGVDGSRGAEFALDLACREASMRGVDLVALHAWRTPGAWEIDTLELADVRDGLEAWLEVQLAERQPQYPTLVMRRIVVQDRPAHGLVEYDEIPQLIVVGSHGRGGFPGMLLGSVSNSVVQSAQVPVMVARCR